MLDSPPNLDQYRSVEELQRLANDVTDEMRTMERDWNGTPFDQTAKNKFSGLANTRKQISERVTELRARRRLLTDAGKDCIERVDDGWVPSTRPTQPDPYVPRHAVEGREAGLRAIDSQAHLLTGRAGSRLEQAVETDGSGVAGRYLAAVASPHYESAFGKLLRDPQTGHLRFTPAEVEAMRRVTLASEERAMAEGTGGAGGFALPFTLDPTVMFSSSGALNPLRQLARVQTITTREWRGLSADTPTAAFAAEGTEAVDNSPTLVQPDIFAEKAQMFVPFSIELEQDWTTLHGELARLFSDAKDILEATVFLTGTGHAGSPPQPTGILSIGVTGGLTTTQRVQSATTAVYAVADPWALKAAIPARWIPSAVWFANPAVWDTTWQFVAAGSTTAARQFDDGRGGDFLGRAKYEWSTMVTTTTTSSRIMLVGDPSTYMIADRIGMQIEVVQQLLGPTSRYPIGSRGLFAYWRTGGAVLVPNAWRYLEVK